MTSSQILIVDDDRPTRALLSRLLEKDGFTVIECNDGREALQILDSVKASLIVSDYEMPEFNGAQLCELVRQSPRPEIASLPIILLTAHAGEEHEVESLQAGANDFVTKPVNAAVLKARIETHLRLATLRRELEEWRHNHEQDLEAARITQRAILPSRLPQMDGWEAAAHYQPVIQVGGDMFDWLRLESGHWLFWIADATGHGASAALLTSLTKLVFRHAASEQRTASQILSAVNAEFYSIFHGRSFMTAACLVLEAESGRLTFSGAGHPPLLIMRASGEVEELRSLDPPVGIVQDLTCGEATVGLAPGEFALLYTDGLYAAGDEPGEHGAPDDLHHVLPRTATSAEQFVRRCLAATLKSATLPDDLALIAVHRLSRTADQN